MMPADKQAVRSGDLRLKPANSNDAIRAAMLHHFFEVPRCSFAKDDGISQYLGSEAGIDRAPASPSMHVALVANVPTIAAEPTTGSGKPGFKLLREAFAGLDMVALRDYEADLAEGTQHHGRSALVGLVARRPAEAQAPGFRTPA